MAVRNIRKQLAGVEDLLLGKGKQDQERSAGIVSITKIDIPAIVETIDELSLVDINKYTTAIVKDLDRGGTFVYDSTKVAENNQGTIFNGWVRQYDGDVNVKWFGAKGDGIIDDTAAIQNAINLEKLIIIPYGNFKVTTLDIKTSISGFDNDKSKLIVSEGVIISKDNINITNVFISAEYQHLPNGYLIHINNGLRNINIYNNKIGYIKNTTSGNYVYAIYIPVENIASSNINIYDNYFIDISKDTPNPTSIGGGFVGAIMFSVALGATISSAPSANIYNNTFENIKTNLSTNLVGSDADAIRFYSEIPGDTVLINNTPITITGNTFINIQKSGIKISGFGGLKIESNTHINTTNIEALCPVRLQTGNRVSILNTSVFGKFAHGFVVSGNDNVIDGVNINFYKDGNITISDGLIYFMKRQSGIENNNHIKNIKAVGVDVLLRDFADTLGNSNTQWFSNIVLKDINITVTSNAVSNSQAFIKISNTTGVIIDDIKVSGDIYSFIVLDNTVNIKVTNIVNSIGSGFIVVLNTQNYININTGSFVFKNIITKRIDTSPRNNRFIDIQNRTSGTPITGEVVIDGLSIVDTFAQSPANNELIFMRANSNVIIKGINVFFRETAAASPITIINGVINNFNISNINVSSEDTSGTGYVIYLNSGSGKGIITGINCNGNYNGVNSAASGVSSVLLSSIRVDSGRTTHSGSGLTVDTGSVVAI